LFGIQGHSLAKLCPSISPHIEVPQVSYLLLIAAIDGKLTQFQNCMWHLCCHRYLLKLCNDFHMLIFVYLEAKMDGKTDRWNASWSLSTPPYVTWLQIASHTQLAKFCTSWSSNGNSTCLPAIICPLCHCLSNFAFKLPYLNYFLFMHAAPPIAKPHIKFINFS
jgi:hypothetical protein